MRDTLIQPGANNYVEKPVLVFTEMSMHDCDSWEHLTYIWSTHESNRSVLPSASVDEREEQELFESCYRSEIEYSLIRLIVNLDISQSIQFVKRLLETVAPERSICFLENFLAAVYSWKSSVVEINLNAPSFFAFGVKNALILARFTILEDFLRKEILESHSFKSISNALKTSEVVELSDFLYFGGAINNMSRISVYNIIGKALNHHASDDTYKNTSVNNMKRENKLLFIGKLKKEFEKALNGSIEINLDKKNKAL